MIVFYAKWIKILLFIFTPFMIGIREIKHNSDFMFYLTGYEEQEPLRLYDPYTAVKILLLLPRESLSDFDLSIDGRLAYGTYAGGYTDLYVWDIFSDNSPVNLKVSNLDASLIGWSPDGRYLAFNSQEGKQKKLYIWDGNTETEVASINHTKAFYHGSWSVDGRLAITVTYTSTGRYKSGELYVWDGHTLITLNKKHGNRMAAWSKDGKLAFLNTETDDYDNNELFVWDGISTINVAPQMSVLAAPLSWTHDGRLAFRVKSSEETDSQVYIWDGTQSTLFTHDYDIHIPIWHTDGKSIVWSDYPLFHVLDVDAIPLFNMQASSPVWTSDGALSFCVPTKNPYAWILSIWNGHRVIPVEKAGEFYGQWTNGNKFGCSYG